MPLLNYTTKVDIFTTLGQIQGMLVKHGAKKILQEYDDSGQAARQERGRESGADALGRGSETQKESYRDGGLGGDASAS